MRRFLFSALLAAPALAFGQVVFEDSFTESSAARWTLMRQPYGQGRYVASVIQDGRLSLQDFFWNDKPAVAESPAFEPCEFFRLAFDFKLAHAGSTKPNDYAVKLELLDDRGDVLATLPWRMRGDVPGARLPGGLAVQEKVWYRIGLETEADGRVSLRVREGESGEKSFRPAVLALPDGARVARLRFKAVDGWDNMGTFDVAKLAVTKLDAPAEDRTPSLETVDTKGHRLVLRTDGGCDVYRKAGKKLVFLAHVRAPILPDETGRLTYSLFDPKAQAELFKNVDVAGIAGAAGVHGADRPTVTIAAVGADGAPKALLRWTRLDEAVKLDLFSLLPRTEQGCVRLGRAVSRPLAETQVFAPVRTKRTNGEPEQETRAMAVQYGKEGTGFLAATAAGLPRFDGPDEWCLPLKFLRRPWQPDRWHAALVLSFRADVRAARMEAEALAADEPLVADVRAGDAFFLTDKPGTVPVRTTVYNAFRLANPVTVRYRAFDADGRRVAEGARKVTAPAFGFAEATFPVPLKEAGPHWVEIDVSHPYGAEFRRICVGALKPVAFANDKGSRMGLAAFRGTAGTAHPEARSGTEMLRLMKRIGVRYLRQHGGYSEEARRMGFTLWYHNQPNGADWNRYWKGEKTWMDEPKQRRGWLEGNLKATQGFGAEAFEFANEWNLADGTENPTRAGRYVKDWLTQLRAVRDEKYPDIRLGGCVVANADLPYLKVVHDEGGWPLFDDLVFHMSGMPRVADNPGPEYWNVLRTLKDIRAVVREYGEKPLYLSEFYAPTAPNVLISMNERDAAADLAIQIALAFAADVKGLMYYCFDDFDRILPIKTAAELGEPTYRENYFGLVRRDWVPKATLWTFATAAELLDGATFLGDVELPGTEKAFGLLFKTPRGPVAFLWSRIDGYPQHEASRANAAHLPPWQSTVEASETVSVKASGDGVVTTDVFGRSRTVPVRNGRAELRLSSEPLFVRGVEFAPVEGHFSQILK